MSSRAASLLFATALALPATAQSPAANTPCIDPERGPAPGSL